MRREGFQVIRPSRPSTSVVFASPHSGREYSWAFLRRSALTELTIRSSEDAYVDRLIGAASDHGAPMLLARVPRAYVDLNRSCEELDPALIEGVRKSGHNPRVASGLGVIPRVVANGRTIYRGKLSLDEAQTRISDYWRPYHAELNALLAEAHENFGEAILVDCHSMPREALDGVVRKGSTRPNVVLGDRFGASASGLIVDRIEAALVSAGFTVVRNTPFAGAYVTQTYGRPSRRQHAIQIEIDRSLYMVEEALTPNADFEDVCAALGRAIAEICEIGRAEATPLAAE